MSRSLTAALISAISQQDINTTFVLIDINFSTPVYYTTFSRAVVYDSNTYVPSAGIMELEASSESVDFLVGTLSLVLSGANQANISAALSEDFIDKQLLIRRAVLDGAGAIIADPVILFDGRLNSYSIDYTPLNGISRVTWEVTTHWADFDRKRGRLTNNESQQSIYPGDKGLEFASAINDAITWSQQQSRYIF